MSFIAETPLVRSTPTEPNKRSPLDHKTSIVLCCLALASYLIQFATNVLLARNLRHTEFEDYNFAMAIVLTLATVATLGFEKLALYLLPVFRVRNDWNRTRGFLISARRSVVLVSISLGCLTILAIETVYWWIGETYHIGIILLIAALPLLSYGVYLVDALTAYGRQVLAAFLYRIVMPSVLLGINAVWLRIDPAYSSIEAATAFFVAWALTTGLLSRFFKQARPPEITTAVAQTDWKEWLSQALPLLLYSLMLTAQGHSGVLILTFLFHNDPVVSEYAMAFNVGTFILLIATATNRFYLPALAVHLERHDQRSFDRDIRVRRFWIAMAVVIFVVAINFSGDHILELFGVTFVRSYPALVAISTGTAVSVIFAPAPYVLQYLGYNRSVLYLSLVSLVLTISGGVYFGSQHGSFGVACSFSACLAAQFLLLKLFMHTAVVRHFSQSKARS